MTNTNKLTDIRCRAVIIHQDKILVVKHTVINDYYALPGGHLEWGENILDCMEREIIEELGIKPKIGKLLYINNLIKDGVQNIEFFFEIINSADYYNAEKLTGTHSHELVEICWIGKNDNKKLLPAQIQIDLNSGNLLSDKVKFI